MGDGKKLKEYLDEKGTNVRKISKVPESAPRHSILLFRRIPTYALILRCD